MNVRNFQSHHHLRRKKFIHGMSAYVRVNKSRLSWRALSISGAQAIKEFLEIGRQRHGPVQGLAGNRMYKSQLRGMEGQARSAARVNLGGTAWLSIVYFFPANRMAELRQMNANLVRSAGFQSAAYDRIMAKLFDGLDIGNRFFANAMQ
jgi:hypothetical protein